jgi:hypothetical protein
VIERYNPELNRSGCYYKGDTPHVDMVEDSKGSWVKYSDYENLQAKLDTLMLEYQSKSMTSEQLQKWTAHQRPV